MPTDPLDDLTRALAGTEALLPAAADRWSDPTPCADWSVLELVEHLIGGHRLFADALTGAGLPERFDPTGVLGDDALAAHRDVARDLTDALSRPGALVETVTVPFGTVPGVVALHVRVVESLVHGWDLARATDQTLDAPTDLVERTLTFTRGLLPNVPTTHRPFGPERPVPDGAPPLARLVALLGREPG